MHIRRTRQRHIALPQGKLYAHCICFRHAVDILVPCPCKYGCVHYFHENQPCDTASILFPAQIARILFRYHDINGVVGLANYTWHILFINSIGKHLHHRLCLSQHHICMHDTLYWLHLPRDNHPIQVPWKDILSIALSVSLYILLDPPKNLENIIILD